MGSNSRIAEQHRIDILQCFPAQHIPQLHRQCRVDRSGMVLEEVELVQHERSDLCHLCGWYDQALVFLTEERIA